MSLIESVRDCDREREQVLIERHLGILLLLLLLLLLNV